MIPSFRTTSNSLRGFILIFFLIISALQLFARAGLENPMSEADRLIAQRRYNEAILELTSVIKKYPERFDDAQKRLQRIVRLRDEYNLVAAELLDVIVNNPADDERKLAMIRKLEDLEPSPNRASREFLLRTKETALFTYNRSQFEQIMARGRALIDAKDWVGAARMYTTGFSLYREEFDQAAYGDLTVSYVNNGLVSIDDSILELEAALTAFTELITRFEAVFSRADQAAALPEAQRIYEQTEAAVLQLAAIRNEIARVGRGFETQFLLLQAGNPALGENSFLPFAFRFILGRKTEIQPEGILGSLDTLWMGSVNRLQAAASDAAERLYLALAAPLEPGVAPERALAMQQLASYADLAEKTVGLWSAVAGPEALPALTVYGRSIVSGKAPVFLRYQTMARAARFRSRASELAERLDALQAESSSRSMLSGSQTGLLPARLLLEFTQEQSALDSLSVTLEEELDRIVPWKSRVSEFLGAKLLPGEAVSYITEAEAEFTALLRRAGSSKADAIYAEYRVKTDQALESAEAGKNDVIEAEALIAGKKNEETGPLLRYPAQSLPLLTTARTELKALDTSISTLLTEIDEQGRWVASDERMAALAVELEALLQDIRSRDAQAAQLAQQATSMVAQAASARSEGDQRYREAISALDRQNFDQARRYVELSGQRYDFSLSIQEDPVLRAERDSKLLALGAEISRLEQEAVVRDVRQLITQARGDYFAGAFERAEDALQRAQLRWLTTNIEDEPEVVYWLGLVRAALSVQTGRTIPVTAPLYPEMSQLLNYAYRAYEEGKSLLSRGRKVDALQRFEEAKQRLQEVRIIFPLNQEASLLQLRIDQVSDPDAFNETFRRKVQEALAKQRSAPQEAYSELQDLYTINPRYPGLKAQVENLEIILGLRLPPPDPRALARSNELTAAAQRIVDANVRSQFPAALTQLDEAIRLNPNNTRAITLKDRINTSVGGTATVVLSAQAEREYQRAISELQQGNTIVALAIVEQLLSDPANKNSSRLIELQRRIQARL